jgi:light-regulated signal transduction histidine kinase (bacteriophytochrome)
VNDLLSFSRMGRAELSRQPVDLSAVVEDVIQELGHEAVGREVEWRVSRLPVVTGDREMLRVVFVNLLSNALKFTGSVAHAVVEIGCRQEDDGTTIVFVRDNGVGFDMAYVKKLFGVFQRLHSADEFPGTGIGLANVHRVIARHGGRTWAEGAPSAGATFYFSLPARAAGPGVGGVGSPASTT